MKILKIAKNFNKYNLSNFTPIKIGNVNVGWVNRKNMRLLEEFSDFFSIKKKTIIIKSIWVFVEEAIKTAKKAAVEESVKAGAKRETVNIVEIDEIYLSYLPSNAVRVKIKAAGKLDDSK